MNTKQLNYKYNSLNARLYRSTYGTDNMPKSFCVYVWKLLLAYIMFIPGWPGHLINKLMKDNHCKSIWFFFHIVPVSMCSGVYLKPNTSHSIWTFYFVGIGGLITILAAAVVLILAFLGIKYLIENYMKDRKQKGIRVKYIRKEKQPSMLSVWWKSFKDKNCPIITWDRNNL